MARRGKSTGLKGSRIVLGTSGGIGCYKAADLTSALVQDGADVTVVMTENAQKFVTPLTFQTLSRRRVYTGLFIGPSGVLVPPLRGSRPEAPFGVEGRPRRGPRGPDVHSTEHVTLADWADIVVVAPATANIIGKYAAGIADDLLSTLLLAVDVPVLLAPAMNERMWRHPAVQENMKLLKTRRVEFIGPESGWLACGKRGIGRMSEPETIIAKIQSCLKQQIANSGLGSGVRGQRINPKS